MPPSVTVLTAVRNGARFIGETIDSVLGQTFTDWEYIIVDDASDDDTPKIVEDLVDKDPRVRLIRRPDRGGPYAAANEGLEHARGKYVVRLDADDVALPHRIERQLSYLSETGLRASASLWLRLTPEGGLIQDVTNVDWGIRSLKWRLGVRPRLVHSTACVERGALEEIGGYRDLPLSQDLRMWCDLARREWLGMLPEVLGHFRRPGGLTTTSGELQERYGIEVLRDHLEALSGAPWTEDEVRALRPGWTGIPVSVRISALRRWVRAWRADDSLSREERRELARLGREVRWQMTKQAIRREGVSFATLRGTLGVSAPTMRTPAR
ncbi:MAG: glycosyltransferase family 2 protein [Actinomycetota bacterium]